MHWAVENNDIQMVDLLLSFKADFDHPDWDGLTPLYYAIEFCDLEMVQKLIDLEANIHIKDKQGW